MRPTSIITIHPAAGPALSVIGDTYRLVLTGAQTNGAFAVIDMLVPPGGGPNPHAHAAFQESFYVVEGEVVVRSETQEYTARPGAFVSIPRGGAVHSFKNESDAVAHLLCTVVPAGLETFFQEIGQPLAPGTFLPPPAMTEEAKHHLEAVAKKHGQELFPPDYLDKQS